MSLSLDFPRQPYHTARYNNLTSDDIDSTELIILAGDATENRGHLDLWNDFHENQPERLISIKKNGKEKIVVQQGTQPEQEIDLRNNEALNDLIKTERLLIDISGLSPNIWAPLLKCAFELKIQTRVLYAEPESYKLHSSPASATLFDLSVRFDGLAPLPGFVRLSGPPDESKCLFVAMLGFEGNRPERLVFQLDPIPKIIPVVGVPGFQLEFPAFTVACNRSLLEEYHAHSELRYARASCPFEAFTTLDEIRKDYPEHYMYIAPIGTKPHALGAIWYAISHPEDTEIMFDHPVRKEGRTKGIGIIHIYDLGDFNAS